MDSSFRERAHRIFFPDAITLKTDTTIARFERRNRLDLESGQVANYGNIFSSFSFPPLCYFRIPRIFPIFALFCHKQRKYWLRGINCAKHKLGAAVSRNSAYKCYKVKSSKSEFTWYLIFHRIRQNKISREAFTFQLEISSFSLMSNESIPLLNVLFNVQVTKRNLLQIF